MSRERDKDRGRPKGSLSGFHNSGRASEFPGRYFGPGQSVATVTLIFSLF